VTANSTLITFYLNTTTANSTDAEDACKRNGGHLAAFTSQAEQREVEQFYITNGYLFPKWVLPHCLPLPHCLRRRLMQESVLPVAKLDKRLQPAR
jgi:hypothetical protein